ncbi:Sec-independent protein translocase protein TatB [Prosthecomicrobium pneumaticum]|uniref:Sec-independent protein translocase protein TatB n=1 Tax=Prosthecomicrobium pneumaticum TaxID=81895 RepID=A0A7W9FPV1_9HYPH|nr:Sec-independent protein translocase protein TatB [Prosthecomicrobium pneumaticum]MBB5754590.1 Tat protein translocase TatB subunit [Prosthecomicrobium pneumaticum]
MLFDIGWSEMLVIAVVAIVVVGPKDLPRMLRAFGNSVGKMRRMAGEFQKQFNEALREAELEDVKKSIDEVRGLNPMQGIRNSILSVEDAVKAPPVAKPAPEPVPPPATTAAQPDPDAPPAVAAPAKPIALVNEPPKAVEPVERTGT